MRPEICQGCPLNQPIHQGRRCEVPNPKERTSGNRPSYHPDCRHFVDEDSLHLAATARQKGVSGGVPPVSITLANGGPTQGFPFLNEHCQSLLVTLGGDILTPDGSGQYYRSPARLPVLASNTRVRRTVGLTDLTTLLYPLEE